VQLQQDALVRAFASVLILTSMAACSSESAGPPGGPPDDAATMPDTSSADVTTPPDAGGGRDSTAMDSAAEAAPSDATAPDAVGDVTDHDAHAGDANEPDGTWPSDASTDGPQGDGAIVCPTDGGIPNDLACTGLYSDWATKTIATGVQAYTPSYLLWSDGALKQRWVSFPALPQGTIDTSNMDDWVFPVGTKVWKQFALGTQIIETRLLWKTASQWNALDYRWSSDGRSATRLVDGETNVNGTTYEIPPENQCVSCHGGRLDMLLGVDLIGLGAPGGAGLRLADLVTQGRLTQAPPATTITIPEDTTTIAAPALGYLHVNCGVTCHNSNPSAWAAFTGLRMKLLAGQLYPADGGTGRVNQLDTYLTAVGVNATVDFPNGMTYMRIDPGNAALSLIPLNALARAPNQGAFDPMPPIISHQADTAGMANVQAWINAL
jgi:hypothetical protein